MALVSMGFVPFTRAIDFPKRPHRFYGVCTAVCLVLPLGGTGLGVEAIERSFRWVARRLELQPPTPNTRIFAGILEKPEFHGKYIFFSRGST